VEDERRRGELEDLKRDLDSISREEVDDVLYDLMVALYPTDESQNS
jgi:hypothetical protein